MLVPHKVTQVVPQLTQVVSCEQ